MVIHAKVIRECAVGPPGECPVQVELVGVTDQELEDLESQVEAQGISFLSVRVQEVVQESTDDLDVQESIVIEDLNASMEELSQELMCPLEPDVVWEDSVCGALEETLTNRVLARVLSEGGGLNGKR